MHRCLCTTVLALGGLLFAIPTHAQTYDAHAEFVPGVSNPNGVWRYGFTTTLGGSFNQFSEYDDSAGFISWRRVGGTPGFYKNLNGSTINGVAPGETALHPGQNGEFAILRFTAPLTTFYDVFGEYSTGDTSNTDAYLLLNGNAGSPLFSTSSTTGGGTFIQNSLSLHAGDTLDYAVGTGGDGFVHDFTPVNLRLAAVVPEPAALVTALLGAISGATLLLRRRRK